DRAPEGPDELRRVETEQQDAVLHLDPELEQRVAGAVDQLEHVRVGQDPFLVDEGGRCAAAFGDVAVDEPGGDVELRGQDVGGDHQGTRARHARYSSSSRAGSVTYHR